MPSTPNPQPLTLPVVNIAARFFDAARQYPTKDAIREPIAGTQEMRATTFAELARLVGDYSDRLQRVGVARGMRTLLFVPPGRDFFALTFALFNIGAVPVMIDPGIGAQQMGKCLTTVDVQAFIGVPKAHVFRLLYRRVFRNLRACITVGKRWFWGGHTLDAIPANRDESREIPTSCVAPTLADETAAILFTSGSTGAAIGVVYTHGIFNA
ncbi:MAG: AMP-binding protein, partial [Phycisphaerae bacterium]